MTKIKLTQIAGHTSEFRSNFSVLLPVYFRDDPRLLALALDSIISNSLQPSKILIVCDGPLVPSLDEVVARFEISYRSSVEVIRLTVNQGLAGALNAGLEKIQTVWVARADADDLNDPERFEKMASFLAKHRSISVLGSSIVELDEQQMPTGIRRLPLDDFSIRAFLKSRSPFNHMSVAFRKEDVLAVGGYPDLYCREDYGLWIRMAAHGGIIMANIDEPLVYAATGTAFFQRRGGRRYASGEIELQRMLVAMGIKGHWRAIRDVIGRMAVFLAPAPVRKMIYLTFLRKPVPPVFSDRFSEIFIKKMREISLASPGTVGAPETCDEKLVNRMEIQP